MNEHTRDVVLSDIKEIVNLNVFAADGDLNLNQRIESLKLEQCV